MTERTDWIIHIEGNGPSHNGESADANALMIWLMRKLHIQGHRFFQARFTGDRPEENLLDQITFDMHSDMFDKARQRDADSEQSSATLGVRKPEVEGLGGESSEGVHPSNTERLFQKPSRSSRR